MLSLTALLLPLAAALPAAEVRKFDPDAHARAIAPFVEGRTFAVFHLDLTQLDAQALAERAAIFTGKEPERIAAVEQFIAHVASLTKAGARDAYMILSLADIPERMPFIVIRVQAGQAAELSREVLKVPGIPHRFGVTEFDGALVLAESETAQRLRDLKPEPRPELARAFASAGPGFFHALAVPTADLPRIVEELLPTLPPELGGGSIKVLTRGLQSIVLAVEPPPKLQLRFIIQASDKEAARALHGLQKRAFALAENAGVGQVRPGIHKALSSLAPVLEGDRLVLRLDEAQFVKAFEEPAEQVREAAERTRSSNNLKQIGLAMHNYLDANGRFPAVANFGKDDKPLLSWRVHLLPYLDQDALYKEFHLDEPWDSDHNKKLIAKMPDVFRSTADGKLAKDGKTTYLAPRGKETMFPPGTMGIRITDITDGTSNTIMLVDGADERAVVWTKPDDLEIDPKEPQKGLAVRARDAFLVLFADGSVRGLPKDIDKKTLWAIFTIAGGEVVEIP
jgi:hypothetical protein